MEAARANNATIFKIGVIGVIIRDNQYTQYNEIILSSTPRLMELNQFRLNVTSGQPDTWHTLRS